MMSEMKPVAWAVPNHMPNDTSTHCELVLYRNQASQNTLGLYTADQLAAAVAAERERIEEYVRERGKELDSAVLSTAFVCDVIAEEIRDGIDLNNAKAPEAIRSAAK